MAKSKPKPKPKAKHEKAHSKRMKITEITGGFCSECGSQMTIEWKRGTVIGARCIGSDAQLQSGAVAGRLGWALSRNHGGKDEMLALVENTGASRAGKSLLPRLIVELRRRSAHRRVGASRIGTHVHRRDRRAASCGQSETSSPICEKARGKITSSQPKPRALFRHSRGDCPNAPHSAARYGSASIASASVWASRKRSSRSGLFGGPRRSINASNERRKS